VDISAQVRSSLEAHPAVSSVRLVGSRQQGTETDLSDWDFDVRTTDFEAVAADLPALVSPLEPLAQQWDRLSAHATYMLMLRAAVKIDLLFLDQPFQQRPAWEVRLDTLQAIDDHFWDWILWLAAKDTAGKNDLVRDELAKMWSHLLDPMGVKRTADSVESAIELYLVARGEAEKRLHVVVSRAIEQEVTSALRQSGYSC
jgi:hypothetical protein